jgi:hypothetical protein
MKPVALVIMSLVFLGGCTSTSLKHYTLNQALTISEIRYRQVMHDLAVIAENSGNLPSFALTAGGTANLTNTVSVDTATLWDQAVKGFSKETLAAFGQHNPEMQWTLDPVVSEPQLEAIGYACMWAVYGPPPLGSRPMEVLQPLTKQDILDCPAPGQIKRPPGYRFGVVDKLACLPCGWVKVGKKHCDSHGALYPTTYKNTTVWITREGLAALSEFTLIVLDIATVDPKSLAVPTPTASVAFTQAKPTAPTPTVWGSFTTSKPPIVAGTFESINEKDDPTDFGPKPKKKGILDEVKFTTTAGDDKVTEIWNACQATSGDAAGPITFSRPTSIRQKILESPNVSFGAFIVGLQPPTTNF